MHIVFQQFLWQQTKHNGSKQMPKIVQVSIKSSEIQHSIGWLLLIEGGRGIVVDAIDESISYL